MIAPSLCRVLIIDDNEAIHQDLQKLLGPQHSHNEALERSRSALFSPRGSASGTDPGYALTCTQQGKEALDLARAANHEGKPFAVAIVDGRMPAGWDGLTTIQHLWREFPDLQIVLCTAFSDHTWEDIQRRLGRTDSLLVVKKPFEAIEIRQAVSALSRKWQLARESQTRLDELRKAQRQVQAIIDYAPSLICLRGLDGRFLLVNGGFCHRFGVTREAIFGRTPTQVMTSVLAAQLVDRDTEVLSQGRTVEWEAEVSLPGGDRTLMITKFPLYGMDGIPYAIAAVMTDLSRRKATEESVRHRVTMLAMARMAGSVAHDFNNLLTSIVGHYDLAIRKLEPQHPLHRPLDEIGKAALQAATLASRLLRFSRQQVQAARPCDLGELLQGQQETLMAQLGGAITLVMPPLPETLMVMVDPEQLHLVLQDLAAFAREMMPEGGQVSVTAALQHSSVGAGMSRAIELVIQDNGPGLSQERLATLFDPFTDSGGGLANLGLAGARAVMMQFGGTISVRSSPGQGTTFTLLLPHHERPSIAEPLAVAKADATAPKATILVAEDEPVIRDLIVQTLEEEGYRVLVGNDGQEALGAAWSYQGPVDLLITDAIMPRLSGAALADRLITRHPRLRVIFMSGYTEGQAIRHQVPDGHADFIQKPFGMADLTVAVRKTLAARSPSGIWAHQP